MRSSILVLGFGFMTMVVGGCKHAPATATLRDADADFPDGARRAVSSDSKQVGESTPAAEYGGAYEWGLCADGLYRCFRAPSANGQIPEDDSYCMGMMRPR